MTEITLGLGPDNGRLMVQVGEPATGLVTWSEGLQLEGTVRAVEFRAGQWRDGLLYGRLRTELPVPT